jgi:glycosyltransferase involved in cell wall biosynthesis
MHLRAGLPAERVHVKPHFVADPGFSRELGSDAVFIGRLERNKGIHTLLEAVRGLPHVSLKVIGDGPAAEEVDRFIADSGLAPRVERLGQLSRERTLDVLRQARVCVVPSEVHETFGLVTIEAFACGIPVVASRMGALPEIVSDGRTGWTVPPGSGGALADALHSIWNDRAELDRRRLAARAEYEERYSPEAHYRRVVEIYDAAVRRRLHSFPERRR